jgi:hypothetical protein
MAIIDAALELLLFASGLYFLKVLLGYAWQCFRQSRRKRSRKRRKPWIYVYKVPAIGKVKIGFSTQPFAREQQITRSLSASGYPKGRFVALMPGTMKQERMLHSRFNPWASKMPDSIEGYTEWFYDRGDVAKWVEAQKNKHPVKRVKAKH